MPTVPNDYSGWKVSDAKADVEAVGLALYIVPNARSTGGHVPTTSEDSDTISKNADDSRKDANKNAGAHVGVVLNAAR